MLSFRNANAFKYRGTPARSACLSRLSSLLRCASLVNMRKRSRKSKWPPSRTHVGAKIGKAIKHNDWSGARLLIESELELEAEHHWFLSRLALTYYEQHEYARALEIEERARALAPDCPLGLWGYAGALDTLGREREAIDIYDEIIERGVHALATDRSGEDIARAAF